LEVLGLFKRISNVVIKKGTTLKQKFSIDWSMEHEADQPFVTNTPDINFDGYPDIEVVAAHTPRYTTAYYFIWKPKEKRFEEVGYFYKLKINQQNKTLIAVGYPPEYIEVYHWKYGKLTLIEKR
jgi:hypothetical protein